MPNSESDKHQWKNGESTKKKKKPHYVDEQ